MGVLENRRFFLFGDEVVDVRQSGDVGNVVCGEIRSVKDFWVRILDKQVLVGKLRTGRVVQGALEAGCEFP